MTLQAESIRDRFVRTRHLRSGLFSSASRSRTIRIMPRIIKGELSKSALAACCAVVVVLPMIAVNARPSRPRFSLSPPSIHDYVDLSQAPARMYMADLRVPKAVRTIRSKHSSMPFLPACYESFVEPSLPLCALISAGLSIPSAFPPRHVNGRAPPLG